MESALLIRTVFRAAIRRWSSSRHRANFVLCLLASLLSHPLTLLYLSLPFIFSWASVFGVTSICQDSDFFTEKNNFWFVRKKNRKNISEDQFSNKNCQLSFEQIRPLSDDKQHGLSVWQSKQKKLNAKVCSRVKKPNKVKERLLLKNERSPNYKIVFKSDQMIDPSWLELIDWRKCTFKLWSRKRK